MKFALFAAAVLSALCPVLAACDPNGMCKVASFIPTSPDDPTICGLYPFGPAPGCGGVEETQTPKKCRTVISDNPGICEINYIVCQSAMEEAPCGTCPDECLGIESACPWLDFP